MSYCKKCGTQLPENASFCAACGTPCSGTFAPQPAYAASSEWYAGEPAAPQPVPATTADAQAAAGFLAKQLASPAYLTAAICFSVMLLIGIISGVTAVNSIRMQLAYSGLPGSTADALYIFYIVFLSFCLLLPLCGCAGMWLTFRDAKRCKGSTALGTTGFTFLQVYNTATFVVMCLGMALLLLCGLLYMLLGGVVGVLPGMELSGVMATGVGALITGMGVFLFVFAAGITALQTFTFLKTNKMLSVAKKIAQGQTATPYVSTLVIVVNFLYIGFSVLYMVLFFFLFAFISATPYATASVSTVSLVLMVCSMLASITSYIFTNVILLRCRSALHK